MLTETIGRHGDCWAWSDDPGWETRVAAAVASYAKELAEKHAADNVPQMLIEDAREKAMARPKRISKNWYKT